MRSFRQCLMAILIVSVGVSSVAYASFPGKNGRIAFSSSRPDDGFNNIYTINSDGSDLRQLTINQRANAWATWSPDGKKIAFSSSRNTEFTTRTHQIYVMDADGGNVTRLTNCPQGRHCEAPGWSPDGKKIALGAIDSTGNFELNVMDADGTNMHQLTFAADDHVGDAAPRFTKDGKQILVTLWNVAHTNVAIYVINVDGTNLRKYTEDSLEGYNGDFNPKNSKIVFEDCLISCNSNILIGDAKRVLKNRTFSPITLDDVLPITTDGNNTNPQYSPDGKSLVFERETGPVLSYYFDQIYTVDLKKNKLKLVPITNNNGGQWRDERPDWQPLPKDHDDGDDNDD